MATFTVTIDFQSIEDPAIEEWCKRNRLDIDSLDDLEVSVEINPAEIDDDELIEEYRARYGGNLPGADAIGRAYRYLAEGDTAAAMDELYAAMPGLRPPLDERRLVTLLRPGKDARNG